MEINAASNAYDIIKAISGKSAQIAFLSGTINPISAENFANFLNDVLHKKSQALEVLNQNIIYRIILFISFLYVLFKSIINRIY